MSLVAAVLARGRAAAEKLMVDACTIKRPTGTTTDPDTADVVTSYTTLYTNQKCRIQSRGQWGERRDVGQDSLVMQTIEVQLPITVANLAVGDVITITAATFDPALVGRELQLKDLNSETHATCRRVMATELTG
jgi:Family of unknown function (DUF6093)